MLTFFNNHRISFLMFVRRILSPLVWGVYKVRNHFRSSERNPGRRAVLVVAKTQLSFYCAMGLEKLLGAENDVDVYVTGPPHIKKKHWKTINSGNIEARPKWIGRLDSLTRRWSLICFPTHYMGAYFHPEIPKVYVNHGLETGKLIFGDRAYTYGWKSLIRRNKTYYTAFLANSKAEFELANLEYPKVFDGKIILTSECTAERLIAMREESETRSGTQESSPPRKKKILFLSSWGTDTLLLGRESRLLREALQLSDVYEFTLVAHANNFRNKTALSAMASLKAAGLSIIEPGVDSWLAYALRADLAISDVTSMSLYFGLLNKPIAFVPVDTSRFPPNSPFHAIYSAAPKIVTTQPLRLEIERCLTLDSAGHVTTILKNEFPYLGRRNHLRGVLRHLLSTQTA